MLDAENVNHENVNSKLRQGVYIYYRWNRRAEGGSPKSDSCLARLYPTCFHLLKKGRARDTGRNGEKMMLPQETTEP